ncbi:MAG: hypothetical protein ABW082_01005 [Sedimenticola sp.]
MPNLLAQWNTAAQVLAPPLHLNQQAPELHLRNRAVRSALNPAIPMHRRQMRLARPLKIALLYPKKHEAERESMRVPPKANLLQLLSKAHKALEVKANLPGEI